MMEEIFCLVSLSLGIGGIGAIRGAAKFYEATNPDK